MTEIGVRSAWRFPVCDQRRKLFFRLVARIRWPEQPGQVAWLGSFSAIFFLPASGWDNLAASELAKQALVLCFIESGRRVQEKARSVGAKRASFPWESPSVVNGTRLFGSNQN